MKQAIQIKKDIYWVGVHDFQLRQFHGALFPIKEGASYNAYLIVDDEITLIDTVEAEFTPILLERIRSVIGDRKIDHIIVQHGEPDHSSGFLEVKRHYPDAKAYCSNAGVTSMMQQYFQDHGYQKVKSHDTLCTGRYTLSFIEMPMIHWPDNMMTYVKEAQVLFSNDAFGQHIVSYQLLDDAHACSYLLSQAKDYFANIVMPYGKQVENKLKEIAALNLEITHIAPSHGIIWHRYIKELLNAYMEFATYQSKDKAVIVYESVWHHTQAMAEALAEGLGRSGIDVKIYQYSKTDRSIIMKELLDAKAVLVGSGCYNNLMAAEIAGFLEQLKAFKFQKKKGLGFGSYGWFKMIPAQINTRLQEAGIALFGEAQSICYTPSEQDLATLEQLGEALAAEIKTMPQ